MKTLLLIPLFSFFSFQAENPGNPLKWKKLRTESAVRTALDKKLSAHTSLSTLKMVLDQEKHVFLQSYGDSLVEFISPDSHARFMISRRWLLRFHFKQDTLQYYTVSEGLTGP